MIKDSNDLKRLIVEQESEKRSLIQELIDDGVIKRKLRASKQETNEAYTYVLDTGDDATKALSVVSNKHNKPETWVKTVKHSPVYKNIIDYSIKNNVNHPTYTLMKDKDVWNTGVKRSLRESTTLSSLLNSLSAYVNLAKRVEDLENITEALVEHAIVTDSRLAELENNSTSTKEKALQMIKEGYTISEVAEVTGKHSNTIRRWRDGCSD